MQKEPEKCSVNTKAIDELQADGSVLPYHFDSATDLMLPQYLQIIGKQDHQFIKRLVNTQNAGLLA